MTSNPLRKDSNFACCPVSLYPLRLRNFPLALAFYTWFDNASESAHLRSRASQAIFAYAGGRIPASVTPPRCSTYPYVPPHAQLERASSMGASRIGCRAHHPPSSCWWCMHSAGGLLRKAWTTWLAYAIRRKELGRAAAMIETRVSAAVATSPACNMPGILTRGKDSCSTHHHRCSGVSACGTPCRRSPLFGGMFSHHASLQGRCRCNSRSGTSMHLCSHHNVLR